MVLVLVTANESKDRRTHEPESSERGKNQADAHARFP